MPRDEASTPNAWDSRAIREKKTTICQRQAGYEPCHFGDAIIKQSDLGNVLNGERYAKSYTIDYAQDTTMRFPAWRK